MFGWVGVIFIIHYLCRSYCFRFGFLYVGGCFIQEQRRTAIEEKLRVVQASRDELQTYATQQSGLVSELQSRNSQLSIDNESLRRRITDLQQV